MIEPGIEADIRPSTVNEVLLVERCHELKRLVWEAGWGGYAFPIKGGPNVGEVRLERLEHTLRLAARADAEGTPFGLRLMARTYGPHALGFGTYMSNVELKGLSILEDASLLEAVHKRLVWATAKFVRGGGQPEDLKPPE